MAFAPNILAALPYNFGATQSKHENIHTKKTEHVICIPHPEQRAPHEAAAWHNTAAEMEQDGLNGTRGMQNTTRGRRDDHYDDDDDFTGDNNPPTRSLMMGMGGVEPRANCRLR